APVLGNASFLLTLNGAQPFAFAAAFAQVNFPTGSTPPLQSFPPCFHVFDLGQPLLEITASTNGAGQAITFMPIRNSPEFASFELGVQWLVIDGTGPIGGITISNALVIRIGEF